MNVRPVPIKMMAAATRPTVEIHLRRCVCPSVLPPDLLTVKGVRYFVHGQAGLWVGFQEIPS